MFSISKIVEEYPEAGVVGDIHIILITARQDDEVMELLSELHSFVYMGLKVFVKGKKKGWSS